MVKKFTVRQFDPKLKSSKDPGCTQRPKSDPWRQNKLNAWSPVYTPQAVLPSMLVIGLAFIPVGIGLLYTSYHVEEISIDYTDCKSRIFQDLTCSEIIKNRVDPQTRCFCDIKFRINHDMERDVYLYYALEGYFQSLRRYASSYDDRQLSGSSSLHLSSSCKPFKKTIDQLSGTLKPIVPCGAIANSLFNDTYAMLYFLGSDEDHEHDNYDDNDVTFAPKPNNMSMNSLVPMSIIETGIAWPSDKKSKFKNIPKNEYYDGFTKPKNWIKDVFQLDPDNPTNNGLENEHLIVWMRIAAFPTFRKLWGRFYHEGTFEDKLPRGYYMLNIEYNYPVSDFGARKLIILSNTSWFGGREFFLAIGYITFGTFTIILTLALYVVHKLWGFTSDEMIDIHVNTPFIDSERRRLIQTTRRKTFASLFSK